jgi:hypothetical protein
VIGVQWLEWNLLARRFGLWSSLGMSVHLVNQVPASLPAEPKLLHEVRVRLIEESERARFDEVMAREHYLKSAHAVGAVLRYVAEYRGQWVALLVFSSPAFHLKLRDQWLHWPAREVSRRRHLLAQNARFLVRAAPGQWPNLASRVLKLACGRLSQDWRQHFGHPVLAAETFVDVRRFRGTCYRAAGWQRLGPTQGHARNWRDFYTDTQHPKELWVKELCAGALEQLRAERLPEDWYQGEAPPPPCPVASQALDSLWECFHQDLTDPRKPKGKRHLLATILTIGALAVTAGCKNPHAIGQFAQSLNHGQRRHLRCRPRKAKPRQYDVPGERTFRRLLKRVKVPELKAVLIRWMAQRDPRPLEVVHLDGKVIKNADPAPACELAPTVDLDTPAPDQKPKADQALTLVNFVTPQQRLVAQIAVPRNTNEEAAVAAHWAEMDLAGVCVTADAAHTVKANARQLTQTNGADYFFILKGNQPQALAKARQRLPGDFPPCGADAR